MKRLQIAWLAGLGLTRPGVDPGRAFPATSLEEVNSPLDVVLNGQAVVVVNKVDWPGATGLYVVDFRVPDDVASRTRLQLSAAWNAGPEAQFPVR